MIRKEIYLGVNIDHVATLRQARGAPYPEPVHAGLVAEHAGAEAITVHLRPSAHPGTLRCWVLTCRLNLEMAVTDEMLGIAEEIAPADCCLVPEKREELTTEGGLDVAGDRGRVASACERLAGAGVRVSLFIDPDPGQLEAASAAGAPVVELHTGSYANASGGEARRELARIAEAARIGEELGLSVNAGHGLHYHNVQQVAAIPQIHELNIGHAIVARAVFSGLADAVREMKRLMREARHGSAE